ncbi:MAG: MucR family transcriptional regulator [Polynucleobacter sp.]|nr:MucR family transcriptional regulator [Sulfuritalea sp.]MDZ4056478.1 MucR family transcriptional regulator [Polynucleobacter sp.]
MTRDVDPDLKLKLASDIVVAFLTNGSIGASELPRLVAQVRNALERDLSIEQHIASDSKPIDSFTPTPPSMNFERENVLVADGSASEELLSAPINTLRLVDNGQQPQASDPIPAVPVNESVHMEYLISLEDGKHYRSLRRHLMAKYGMTPEAYREKWGLPSSYPMVAPSYAMQRSEVAKRSGLGYSRKKEAGKRQKEAGKDPLAR